MDQQNLPKKTQQPLCGEAFDQNAVDAFREKLDEILAIPQKRLHEYCGNRFQLLHPMVQAAVVRLLPCRFDEGDLFITPDDAFQVFYLLGQTLGCYTQEPPSPTQEKLCGLYRSVIGRLRDMALDEEKYIDKLLDNARSEQQERQKELSEALNRCSASTQAAIGYEIAKRDPSQGERGVHLVSGKKLRFPFTFCGYADTIRDWYGVAIMIDRECFAGRDPELYCMDSDWFGYDLPPQTESGIERMCGMIAQYSSGISDVCIRQTQEKEAFFFQGTPYEPCCVRSIRFRLDREAIKEITVDGHRKTLRGYILVIPKTGEFSTELGEIIDGKHVPLLSKGFCMK